MSDEISGRQVAAARALTGISREESAEATGREAAALSDPEANGRFPRSDLADARSALESFGAVFLTETASAGAGVRLKFTRRDVKQIGRLENEGGPVGEDDVP